MKKLTALIDGDIYIFKAAAAAEHPIQWTEDLWTLHAHMSEAVQMLDQKIESIRKDTGATDILVALSDTTNFRYDIYPHYKHNRKDKRPPLLRAELKEYVQAKYPAFLRPGLEGDDVLGIVATSEVIVKGDKIIVSEDKDMKTIPGRLYNTGKRTYADVTEREADYWHLLQTLTGDTTDGYPGCPGYGPVKAQKLLGGMLEDTTTPLSYHWQRVVAAYEKAGLCEAEALTQARIARICRKTDYNFKTKEVILWTPPNAN